MIITTAPGWGGGKVWKEKTNFVVWGKVSREEETRETYPVSEKERGKGVYRREART